MRIILSKMFQLSDTLFIRESSFPKGPIPKKKDLLNFFKNDEALEAIYFGSPVFYNQVTKVLAGKELSKKESKKFFTTAYKYYTRASNRATPFALFSKVGLVDSNAKDSVNIEKIVAKLEPIIFIRLLRTLAEKEEIKQYIRYSINKSILSKEDEIVFTTYDLIAGRRYFAIQSFDSNHYISWLIENCSVGLSYNKIAKSF